MLRSFSKTANYYTRWWGCMLTIIHVGEDHIQTIILISENSKPTIIPTGENHT